MGRGMRILFLMGEDVLTPPSLPSTTFMQIKKRAIPSFFLLSSFFGSLLEFISGGFPATPLVGFQPPPPPMVMRKSDT